MSTLAEMVDEHALATGARKNKRKGTSERLEYAVGAFLADLLRAYGQEEPDLNPWVYRSMHAKSFTGAKVSFRTFSQLVDGLERLTLLVRIEGHKVSQEDRGRFAARFSATPALLAFCKERAVDPAKVYDHFEFEYDLPKEVLELRATKESSYWVKTRLPGKPMSFERDGVTNAIEGHIRELNEFFAQHRLRGGSHHGYVRIFHNGDDPCFSWNMGGRLYSQHFADSYQVMSADQRLKMTIDGEPVAEIDIRASYLTIFLSLCGIQLPHGDPYELPGLGPEHRSAVKAWMVATFGNSKPIVRWPPRMLQKSPDLKQHRVSVITAAALTKYPALKTWGEPLSHGTSGWAGLMWFESNVMISTMLKLKREHQLPSLSVHDSLIVPARAAEKARTLLEQTFQDQQGVAPLLKINHPRH
ncbi:hypothetical protein IQ16_07610 [Bradyrhizobium huanghuaihaiense]|uniref:DNA-directed DNA polymerase family A palm domain-containing protein n=1 Tax=Bradyrhizobium huanghuaihaiense TaxID=990078 RepID=A0A562QW70_9BRAD|nr:hypothetical protein IQ16_07610 [Bradyrhizobium huanghuaihaiense]